MNDNHSIADAIYVNVKRIIADLRSRDHNYPKLAVLPQKFTKGKVCNTCGKVHHHSPTGSEICNQNWHWFNCSCGSTLINTEKAKARQVRQVRQEKLLRQLNKGNLYGSKRLIPQTGETA